MRYTEPTARSAELLHPAPRHTWWHDAAFNPVAFALWAEYAAGIESKPSAAIDALRSDSAAIDDAAVRSLYRHADEATTERVGDEFQRFMCGSAASSSNRADLFGALLTGLSAAQESSACPFPSDLAATA